MLPSLLYILTRRILELVALRVRSRRSKGCSTSTSSLRDGRIVAPHTGVLQRIP